MPTCESRNVVSDVIGLLLVLRTDRRDLVTLQKMGVIIHDGNTSAGRWG